VIPDVFRKPQRLFVVFIVISISLAIATLWATQNWQAALDVLVIALAIMLFPGLVRTLRAYLHLGWARLGFRPRRASGAYVRALFDGYAERFDEALFDELDYTGPRQLHELFEAHGKANANGLAIGDLGCGTGACGPLFRDRASELVGVDLSPKMLAKALERDVYDQLHQAELLTFLRENHERFDLLLAADVFVYFGDLGPVMEAAAGALRPEGRMVFSVEHQEIGDYRLDSTGRYKHAPTFIQALATHAGFVIRAKEQDTTRLEAGEPVEASLWLIQKTGGREPMET
jgi:predicted TPR repeat methyltransferase